MDKKRLLGAVLFCFFLIPIFASADELFTQRMNVADAGTYNILVQSLTIAVRNIELTLDEDAAPFIVSLKAMQSSGPKDYVMKSFVLREYFVYTYLNLTSDLPLSDLHSMKLTLSIPRSFFYNYSYVPERLEVVQLSEMNYAPLSTKLTGFDAARENYVYEAKVPHFGLYAVVLRKPEYNYLYLKRQSDFLFEDFNSASTALQKFSTTGSWVPYLGALTYKLEERSSAAFQADENLTWTSYNVTAGNKNVKRYYAVAGEKNWSNYTFSADVKAFEGEHRKIVFRYQNESNYYFLDLTTKGYLQLGKTVEGYDFPIAAQTAFSSLEHWYSLKVTADGNHFTAYVDEQPLIETFDPTPLWDTGRVGFMVDGGIHGVNYLFFDNARVWGYKLCRENCCPEGTVACFEAEKCVTPGSKRVGERYDCAFECVYDYGKDGLCGDAFSTELSIEAVPGASSSLALNFTNNLNETFSINGAISVGEGLRLSGEGCVDGSCAVAVSLEPFSSYSLPYAVACDKDTVHAAVDARLSYTYRGEDVQVSRSGFADCKYMPPKPAVQKEPEKGFWATMVDFFKGLFS